MTTIVDYDWLETFSGRVLHHARIEFDGDDDDIVEALWTGRGENVRLDCGRTAKRVWIPGLFTRMSAPRCQRCCVVNELPQGVGSPKNDQECRRILGLPEPRTSLHERLKGSG